MRFLAASTSIFALMLPSSTLLSHQALSCNVFSIHSLLRSQWGNVRTIGHTPRKRHATLMQSDKLIYAQVVESSTMASLARIVKI